MSTCEKRTRYKKNSSDDKIGWLIGMHARHVSSTQGFDSPPFQLLVTCVVQKATIWLIISTSRFYSLHYFRQRLNIQAE